MRISDWSSDVCPSDLNPSPRKWRSKHPTISCSTTRAKWNSRSSSGRIGCIRCGNDTDGYRRRASHQLDEQNRLEAAPASRSPTTTKQKRGTRERVRRVTCRPPSIPNLQHLLLRDTTSKPPGPHLQHTLGVERYHQAQQTITQLARPRHRFGQIGRAHL